MADLARVLVHSGGKSQIATFASVQIQEDEGYATLLIVRQFSDRESEAPQAQDALIGRLVVELGFGPAPGIVEVDHSSMDFPANEDWASVVEGDASFQSLINRTPDFSGISFETG